VGHGQPLLRGAVLPLFVQILSAQRAESVRLGHVELFFAILFHVGRLLPRHVHCANAEGRENEPLSCFRFERQQDLGRGIVLLGQALKVNRAKYFGILAEGRARFDHEFKLAQHLAPFHERPEPQIVVDDKRAGRPMPPV
jgi:hypothetical protein